MDSETFVRRVEVTVRDAAVDGVLSTLARPPGRRPAEAVRQASAWYASLDDAGRVQLRQVIEMAADHAVFGFLCVLDGVRTIENGRTDNPLRLSYQGQDETVLNGPDQPMLHELYNAR